MLIDRKDAARLLDRAFFQVAAWVDAEPVGMAVIAGIIFGGLTNSMAGFVSGVVGVVVLRRLRARS